MTIKSTVGLIVGSTREGRQGEKVARWVETRAQAREEFATEFIDLAHWVFPFYRHPLPARVAERSYTDAREAAWVALVRRMDAFIIVVPEYNHGYPAGLKNALDYVSAGWARKPVAFVSYGGSSGGVRAVEQLRLVAIELQLAPIRDEVNLPFAHRALDEHGVPVEPSHGKRLEAMLGELSWWSQALKAARTREDVPTNT